MFGYVTDYDIISMKPPHMRITAYNGDGDDSPDPDNLTLDTQNTTSR